MKSHEKLKLIREMNKLTQENMAEKLDMSVTGYAKIERGQTNVSLEKLKQIAMIFNINVAQLLDDSDTPIICSIGDNHSNYNNYFGMNEALVAENQRQKLELEYKDQLLLQKENEILALKKVITLLENKPQLS
ncbi:MAG: helix-turn-helix transcriptional regulator [Pasteurellaceae bacterium]|nr:helix-turn-helix transcriptional regulator [Pasteurellaceae bacterium]